jgi:hypothetical protein
MLLRPALGFASIALVACSLANDLDELRGNGDAGSSIPDASTGASGSAGAGGSPAVGGSPGAAGSAGGAGKGSAGNAGSPPTGPHYGYVVNQIEIPTTNEQVRQLGLDLDGDGVVDNRLGTMMAALGGQGLDLQRLNNAALARGDLLLLLELQTPSFSDASGAALWTRLGHQPLPAPCIDPEDFTSCGQHLTGGASFQIAADSPDDAFVLGKLTGGTFAGGPGKLMLRLLLASGAPITVNLVSARASIGALSESSLEKVILAGALTQTEIDTNVIPALQTRYAQLVAQDCVPASGPPECGCDAGSMGETVIGLFDTSPKDCTITYQEIRNNTLIQNLLSPDITIDGQPLVSVGVGASAVEARFPGVSR